MKRQGKNFYWDIRTLAFERAKEMAIYQDVIVVHKNVGTHEPRVLFLTEYHDISNFRKIKNIDFYELIPTEVEDEDFYIGNCPEPFYEPETQVYLFSQKIK